MYEIAICDDQKPLCEKIYKMVSEFLLKRDIDIRIHIFTTGRALLETGIVFDILLLDIELGKENGLDIAMKYPTKKETRIIFITSHIEEMQNGYKTRAFRFLTKPIKQDELEDALMDGIKDIEKDIRLIISDEEGVHVVRASEIIYFESHQRSTGIRTLKHYGRISKYFEEMVQELSLSQFYRTHKSFVVNMDFIRSIDKQKVILKNGEMVKISRLKQKHFKESFQDYIRSRASGE